MTTQETVGWVWNRRVAVGLAWLLGGVGAALVLITLGYLLFAAGFAFLDWLNGIIGATEWGTP